MDDLPLTWEPLVPVTGIAAALAAGAVAIHLNRPDNILVRGRVIKGTIDDLPGTGLITAEGSWETSYVEHAYIEPEAGYAQPLADGHIDLVVSTQTPYMDRDEVAHVLGITAVTSFTSLLNSS
jgi:CO/xanthine dehydrogenase Mo-binding subunit